MKNDLISKFLIKLLILTSILLFVAVLDKYSIISYDEIKNHLKANLNFVNVIKQVNGEFNIIDLTEITESVSINDEIIYNQNNNTYTYYKKTNKVYSKTLGSVMKISKDKNDLYSISILDENNNIVEYQCLENINVKIYQIIKKGEEIGGASLINDINDNSNDYFYYYLLTLNEN